MFSFFLFLILRQPRSPPLFPYTTLFRSRFYAGGIDSVRGYGRRRIGPLVDDKPIDDRPAADGLVVDERDRKSTRLNSSHLGISYAVFCLKKKTRHNHTISIDDMTDTART